jgi:hypothetical protein
MKTKIVLVLVVTLLIGCKKQNENQQLSEIKNRLDFLSNEVAVLQTNNSAKAIPVVDFYSAHNFSNCITEVDGKCLIKINGNGYFVADQIWVEGQLETNEIEAVTRENKFQTNLVAVMRDFMHNITILVTPHN